MEGGRTMFAALLWRYLIGCFGEFVSQPRFLCIIKEEDYVVSNTTSIGIKYKDFIILGADSRATNGTYGYVAQDTRIYLYTRIGYIHVLLKDVKEANKIADKAKRILMRSATTNTLDKAAQGVKRVVDYRVRFGKCLEGLTYLVGGRYHSPGAPQASHASSFGLCEIDKGMEI